MDVDVDGAAIHVHDRIQDERVVVYDKDNPELKLEARFPSMDEFRLAVRTYVIKAKFELFMFKTDRERYDAYCRADKNCTWHVHERTERLGGDTVIVCLSFSCNFIKYIMYAFLSHYFLSFVDNLIHKWSFLHI
jgi:hypothetical protein